MDNLDPIMEIIRAGLEAKNAARERILDQSRALVRQCANAIRAMHRRAQAEAQQLLAAAGVLHQQMRDSASAHGDLYAAGYTQDGAKEYVEASLTYALIGGAPFPTPAELGVEHATYLNGMAEAASELRRYILDLLRADEYSDAETLLGKMETIYDLLMTFDFPDAISGGLRHRADALRGILERTRGDVTLSIRQKRLQDALVRAERSNQHPD